MPKQIIVVEDDPQISDLLQMLLEAPDLEIRHFTSGREGLEGVIEHQPNLVLLDVKLPEMTGWEVIDAIRAHEAVQHIPVIMLSVSQPEEVERRAMFTRSTVNFYMPKPFDLLKLRRKITEILDVSQWEVHESTSKPDPADVPIFPIDDDIFQTS